MKAQFKAAVVTCPGFEDVAAREVEELIGIKATAASVGIVTFSVKELTCLCRLCYLLQSASAVLLILSGFNIGETVAATAGNLRKSLRGADFKMWFSGETTFKVDFQPVADASPDFPTSEIEAEAGTVMISCVKSSTGFAPKVDLRSPAVTISIYASAGTAFCGIAINPFDLSKREYRVFSHSSDIKGNLAYLLLRSAGYEPEKFLFDPFARAGTIAVEAATFSSGFPVSYYRRDALSSAFSRLLPFSKTDFSSFFAVVGEEAAAKAKKRLEKAKLKILSSSQSMQFVRSAEKNAKIAGVHKLIRFSRLDIEWLDAKLDEQSVDLVVSYPPQFKSGSDSFAAVENKRLAVLYRNFFCHADFFLKKKGSIALLMRKGSYGETKASALAYKFKPEVIKSFKLGAGEFELVAFGRNL